MRRLRGLAIAAILATPASAATPAASAAEEVGTNCTVNTFFIGSAVVQLSSATGGPPPPTAQAPGIATRWRINWPSGGPGTQVLEVFRATSTAKKFTLVGQSAAATVVEGPNTLEARIPVQAGDRFGLYGSPAGGACTGAVGDVLGYSVGTSTVAPGMTQSFNESSGHQVAVSVVIEPDRDGDGYGDETQDGCPQSAQIHEACPPLTLSLYSIAQRSSAIVLVSAGVPSQITVSAKVAGVPKKKRAGSSATIKLKPVTHLANPGQITKYKLKFTAPLKAALANLPSGKSLALKVEASGANLAGVVKSEERTLRLKGQG